MSTCPPHPALEWLVRRRDGESVALIGWRDDVPASTVHRATDPYGPFPRPTRHLGRTQVLASVATERSRRWVAARRRGQSVTTIAAREGVRHQIVSRATADYGPFPGPEAVQEWVAARRAGRTLAQIAADDETTVGLVSRSTRPHGPFSSPGPRLPDGVVGLKGLARLVGVSEPTVVRWVRQELTPAPDFVTAAGRRLWLPHTLTTWLETADLTTCPACGARCVSLGQHRATAHRT